MCELLLWKQFTHVKKTKHEMIKVVSVVQKIKIIPNVFRPLNLSFDLHSTFPTICLNWYLSSFFFIEEARLPCVTTLMTTWSVCTQLSYMYLLLAISSSVTSLTPCQWWYMNVNSIDRRQTYRHVIPVTGRTVKVIVISSQLRSASPIK